MKRWLLVLALCAQAARGQEEPAPPASPVAKPRRGGALEEEPSPFWLPPPPPAKTKKKKPPPVQLEPLEIKKKKQPAPPPRAEKKKKPPPKEPEPPPPPPKEEVRAPEQRRVEPPPPPVRTPAPVETAPPPVRAPAKVETAPAARAPSPVIIPPPLQPVSEPEQEVEEPKRGPRFTADAIAGLWGKTRSDGSGRLWDLAYGLRAGYAVLPDRLEAELLFARAGSSAGTSFVSAGATHNLFALRALWVLGTPRFSLLVGGGGGAVWVQTRYSLSDVGGTPASLDANPLKLVMEITAAGRARIVGGLEARLEVSAMLRDGALEFLPLAGLGAAF